MINLTGDTHNNYDIHKLTTKAFPDQKEMTKDDFVIILGDWGVLWNDVPDKTEKHLIKWYNEKKIHDIISCWKS